MDALFDANAELVVASARNITTDDGKRTKISRIEEEILAASDMLLRVSQHGTNAATAP